MQPQSAKWRVLIAPTGDREGCLAGQAEPSSPVWALVPLMAITASQQTLIAFICLISCNLIFGLCVSKLGTGVCICPPAYTPFSLVRVSNHSRSLSRSSVVYKVGLRGITPIILSFYRQLFATPILAGVCAGVDRAMPDRSDHVWFILIGLFGVFLNQTMYTYAVYYAGAALASILQLTNTPTTAGMAILVGLEKFTWYKGAGLLGAVSGAAIMVSAGKPTEAAANRTLGIVISLVQAFFISFWVVIAKKYLYVKYSPTTVAAGMHVTGLPWIIMAAFSMFGFSGPGGWESFKLDTTGIWVVVYAFLFHSVIAYLCLNYANSTLDASICATFGTLNPLFGSLAGVLILGETVGPADVIGALLILTGLGCVVYQRYLDGRMAKTINTETLPGVPLSDSDTEEPHTTDADSVADSTSNEFELQSGLNGSIITNNDAENGYDQKKVIVVTEERETREE